MRPNIKGLTHDHIDGSMAMRDIILDLYQLAGKPFPFLTVGDWLTWFRTDTLKHIVEKFGSVTSVLQTEESLEMAGYAYGKRRAEEGYVYAEAKFAPMYHTFGGLSLHRAVSAMYTGLKKAEGEFGITILPVVTINREATPEEGAAIARVALRYDGEVALDMACDEAANPPEKHLPAYRMTFGSNVRRDCHAGEWVSKEPAHNYETRLRRNIRTAIYNLHCHSIGHAIPLAGADSLVDVIAGEGIRIAGNPLSNLNTGCIDDVRKLGIAKLLDAGVIYTLNADDDLFLPSMPEVVAACDAAYDFTAEQCQALEENVFRGALDPRMRID